MEKIYSEIEKFKADTNIFDKVFVLLVRCTMIYGIINIESIASRNLMMLNFCATFTCEFMHYFSPKTSFVNQISYKINTHLSVFVLLGSFFGHYICLYSYFSKYDWILHTMAGASAVFVGYLFVKPLVKGNSTRDNQLLSLVGFLFSSFGLAFWEITEFWSDFVLGSNNQGYTWIPAEDSLFVKIFGYGANIEQQHVMFDTMIDMSLAFVASIVATILLFSVLQFQQARQENKTLEVTIKPREYVSQTLVCCEED